MLRRLVQAVRDMTVQAIHRKQTRFIARRAFPRPSTLFALNCRSPKMDARLSHTHEKERSRRAQMTLHSANPQELDSPNPPASRALANLPYPPTVRRIRAACCPFWPARRVEKVKQKRFVQG